MTHEERCELAFMRKDPNGRCARWSSILRRKDGLRELVLKAAEECVPTLDKAIADLRNTLESW
jgi:hypothetical protein